MAWPRTGWTVPLLVAGLLLCAVVAPTLVAGERTGHGPVVHDAGTDFAGSSFSEAEQEFDRTEFRITVHENGSATWLFRYEQTLSNDDERDDFETFAEEFNAEETTMYENFVDRAMALTESGADATSREMSAEAFDRRAFVSDFGNQGVVEMSFRWEGFAVVDGDRLIVSDVFEGGFYIASDQRLVFVAGDGLAFDEVTPETDDISGESLADSSSVTYEGERSFTDNRPRVVYVDADDASGGTPGESTETETGASTDSEMGWMLPAGAVLFVVLLGLGAAVAYRSGALPRSQEYNESATATTPNPGDSGDTTTAETGATSDTNPTPAVSDAELIADDERVIGLLEDNGGRMKQVKIVEETGWSKSKVSMLLSEMETEDRISKLRVGRENIISLPGHEPDAARSPFEDE